MKRVLFDEILPRVTKPSRYLGTEVNTTHKDPSKVDLRVGLAFPDLYELGLGNLGLHILYSILNDLPWCWAERAYAPAPDMEQELRGRELPLFALESKTPLNQMDMLGFSLQTELTYTSVLNILDLSGIPLRSAMRDDNHPLVFAGGPTAVNPEPMAPFIDFFVIGDAEEAVVEIAEIARAMRGMPRDEKLEEIGKLSGVYVPGMYPYEPLPDGRALPRRDAPKVIRRLMKEFDAAHFPTRYIVPFTQLIHDRVGIEVLRGCTHGCRFCQAGMSGRPVRARELETIDGLLERLLDNTGYEEVSLLSLSTCDYPKVRTLLQQSAQRTHPDKVALSVPSLRLDTFSVELADAITGVRRSGLTFAPEVATRRMRAVINKAYEDEELIEVATEAFKRGWSHIKCYFMIGLPTERDEDVEAIADLCIRVLTRCRTIDHEARLFTGISTFVPKPFTPFQWAEQIRLEEIVHRQRILERKLSKYPGIKFGRHEPESTYIEGLISRADHRIADVIEAAFRKGARLESSSEFLDFDAWQEALADVGYDDEDSFRERDLDEPLPWDHIDVLIPKLWFQREWRKAANLEGTPDCRLNGCQQCGLRDHAPGLCAAMEHKAKQGALHEETKAPLPVFTEEETPPVQRMCFRIGRSEEARFLSHLEFMNAWVRALRRAKAPLSYSQGFHAHPKITFATAMPVGEESEGDYMDILLKETFEPQELLKALQATLPMGFNAYEAKAISLSAPSLMSLVSGFDYAIQVEGLAEAVRESIRALLERREILVEREGKPTGKRRKRTSRMLDLRPMISRLELSNESNGYQTIEFSTVAVENRMVKPKEILELLGLDIERARIRKRATRFSQSIMA